MWPVANPPVNAAMEYQCARSARNPNSLQVARFSVGNGNVPGPLPEELRDLTMAEEALVSRGFPVMKVVHLAGGMHGYRGHVLSMGQDIGELAERLPWRASSDDLPIVVVRPASGDGRWGGREFKLSLMRVERALNYLIRYNPAYKDIVRVDMARLREQLASLPREGDEVDIMGLLHTVNGEEEAGVDDGEENVPRGRNLDVQGVEPMPNPLDMDSFIPCPGNREESEAEALRRALRELAGGGDNDIERSGPLQYPVSTGPIPENRPWLASACFPTLFPEGTGDPFGPPTERKVELAHSIKHLMRFADRREGGSWHYRFASHRTFRYWCLDIRLRIQARTQCRVFLKNNPALVNLDPNDVDDGTIAQLMQIATRYVANLPGTDGYWMQQRSKLESAVEQLPSLTAFTTYSAADFHWADLYRLMPREGPEPEGDNVRPHQERGRLLIENPHIADWWIWERYQVWKKVFLGADMADATWSWDRAEFQSRASLHIHGCASFGCEGDERLVELSRIYLRGHIGRTRAQMEGGIPGDDGGVPDEEFERVQLGIKAFLEGVGFTARNPNAPQEGVPISEETRAEGTRELEKDMRGFNWDNIDDVKRRYHNIMNAAQRHIRHGTYCLKNGRCRFGFPKARLEEMRIEAHPLTRRWSNNEADWQVVVTPPNAWPAAEGQEGGGPCDRYVNRHLPVMLVGWGANVDFSAIVDQGGCQQYMVKYCAKGESRSKDGLELLTFLVRRSSEQDASEEERLELPAILRRVLMKATTRRDMGVQEVQHLNLETSLVLTDVEFVRASTQNTVVEVRRREGEGGTAPVRDLLVAYSTRMDESSWTVDGGGRPPDNELEAMNYCEFCATFKLTRDKRLKRHDRTNRVVTFVPFFSHKRSNPKYPDYCRTQLVKLKPWQGGMHNGWGGREEETADTEDEAAREGMISRWREYATTVLQGPIFERPYGFSARDLAAERRRGTGGDGRPDLEEDNDSDNDGDDNLDGLYGGGLPEPEDDVVRTWDDGSRGDVDWAQNRWSERQEVREDATTWVHRHAQRGNPDPDRQEDETAAAAPPPPALNEKQDLAVSPLRMLLTGTAGTGKTVVIREMVRRVGRDRFKLLAPTGNAACAIEGQTIHTGLYIPVNNRRGADPSQLAERARLDLQRSMHGVDFILVDEFSMVGQDMLGLMSARGRQAVEGRRREGGDLHHEGLFGGLSVIFVGDPMQLPAVGASAMWSPTPSSGGLSIHGLQAWNGFNHAVELTQVMRQLGPEQAAFRATLLRIAEGMQRHEDMALLRTRFTSAVSEREASSFDDAVHIFPTNAAADEWNWTRTVSLGTPVAKINASHTIPGFTSAPADRFRGLEGHLFLAVGARVFINNNIWTSAGLANGSVGEVVHMQWADGAAPPSLPEVVWVKVENYRGPQYFTAPLQREHEGVTIDLNNVVPIAPIDAIDDQPPAARRRSGGLANPHAQHRCVRTQLPLMLAFGITIHKSQGQTLHRCFLDIGDQERTDGQSFTAFSRCRAVENMLLQPFSCERFMRIGQSRSFEGRLQALDRIRQLEDRTRRERRLTPLRRFPRPRRETSVAAPPNRGRGRGRGRRGRGGQGRGRRTTGGRGPGGRPSLPSGPQTPEVLPWTEYAVRGMQEAATDSWLYVPFLFDVLHVNRHQLFHNPAWWAQAVQDYRAVLTAQGQHLEHLHQTHVRRAGVRVYGEYYIDAHLQEQLLGFGNFGQSLGQMAIEWRNRVQLARAHHFGPLPLIGNRVTAAQVGPEQVPSFTSSGI
ncbi:unnamed protein product [Scytosiphon promiscuus]